LIDRVELGQGSFRVTILLGAMLGGGHAEVTLARELPLAIKRRGVEMRLVSDSHNASPAKADPILLKEVAPAHRCFDALLFGRASSIAVSAAREGTHGRYVSSLQPLAFLAPEIVEAIVRGTQPKDLTAKKLIRRIHLPLEWQSQKQALGSHSRRRRTARLIIHQTGPWNRPTEKMQAPVAGNYRSQPSPVRLRSQKAPCSL